MPDKAAVRLIECPRDAMQGIPGFIPTELKVSYINTLLRVGFDVLDFGSFVSPRHIPQMKDTAQVTDRLDMSGTNTRLLAIVANERGARDAVKFNKISILGFPFSISETFQVRNTNSTIMQSFNTVELIYDLCRKHNKELVVYLSMAFGNPYGDDWNTDVAAQWVGKIAELGVKTVSLADTVGVAREEDIGLMFSTLIPAYPGISLGAHLHCTPDNWRSKVGAAYDAGCRRFDAVIRGFGGCPMADNKLVGNLATENLVRFLEEKNVETGLDNNRFNKAMEESMAVFA